jgi:hypothetical protein
MNLAFQLVMHAAHLTEDVDVLQTGRMHVDLQLASMSQQAEVLVRKIKGSIEVLHFDCALGMAFWPVTWVGVHLAPCVGCCWRPQGYDRNKIKV